MKNQKMALTVIALAAIISFNGCSQKNDDAPMQKNAASEKHSSEYFPIPQGEISMFMETNKGESLNFQVQMPMTEALEFYKQELIKKGLTERTLNTAVTDSTFSIVYDGSENSKAVVVQGVKLEENKTNINIRFEEV